MSLLVEWLVNLPSHSFMAHPETLLPMPTIDDPVERFVSVIRFYLSGWHIKPPYVIPVSRAGPVF